jgi:hypothetical protein
MRRACEPKRLKKGCQPLLVLEGVDPAYESLRKPPNEHCVECRQQFLALWELTNDFLDRDLIDRARSSLHSAYWEMQVTGGLLEAGAVLVPRGQRSPRNAGPDLLSTNPHAWIEAIAVEAGKGDDAVPEAPEGVAYSVPDNQILLRIVQAIDAKRAKREDYLSRKWLRASDPYVVAVNSGNLPNGKSELPLPRIVRAVFPFGHYAVFMDVRTGNIAKGFYEHRAAIQKRSGAPVATTHFEDPAFAGISGCLYSVADAFNPPHSLARSLILVHNPLATAPLPRDSFRGLMQYWREGDELHWREPTD